MHGLANFKFVGFSLFYVLLTSQCHKLMMQHLTMSNVISTGSTAATRQFSFHVPGTVYTVK